MKQSYRATRTNIVIGWVSVNVALIYLIDAIVLSAVNNGNVAVKEQCQILVKIYVFYCLGYGLTVVTLSGIHTLTGNLTQLLCSKYMPATIRKRAPVSSETKVLLDDTDEETFTPMIHASKKGGQFKKDLDSNTDLESYKFMEKYKKNGGWTY